MPNRDPLNIALECKDIIKKNSPEKSIDIISKMKTPDGEKIGKDNALKIYKIFSLESVEYKDEYKFNYRKYMKNVDKNIDKATKYQESKSKSIKKK
jgi:hypothetical protein